MSRTNPRHIEKLIRSFSVLIAIGIQRGTEAGDGIEALEAIHTVGPDVVLLDWELPMLGGDELVRMVRSPRVSPTPDLPIIVLSAHGERRRVLEAMRLGVNEYLIKPISAEALRTRLIAAVASRRPTVQPDDGHPAEPRQRLPG